MSRPLLTAIFFLVALLTATGAFAFELDIHDNAPIVAGRALVVLQPDARPAAFQREIAAAGMTVAHVSDVHGRRTMPTRWLAQARRDNAVETYVLVQFDPKRSYEEMAERLRASQAVAAVWPDHVRSLAFAPNDPLYNGGQLNLRQIGLEKVWNRTRGDGVIVAVLDTGYLMDGLTDGAEHVLDGWDYGERDDDPDDTEGHGTHVANIIAERTDNGVGAAGAAPDIKLLPVKVFPDHSGGAAESDIIDGIYFAVEEGAQVINMSLGGPGYNGLSDQAVTYATDHDVVVVVASGNESLSEVSYPAGYDDSVAVGSCDKHQLGELPTRSDYSNYGDALDLVAPGEEILGETIGNGGVGFYYAWGTSVASPHVAAGAALMIASNPDVADARAIKQALEETATRKPGTDWDVEVGWGEINVRAAVESFAGAIPNESPTALIVADKNEGEAPLTISFTASASDPDGNIDRYLWSFSNGDTSNLAAFSYTFDEPGEYSVMLSVIDEEGASGSDQLVITVRDGDKEEEKDEDEGFCAMGQTGGDGALALMALSLALFTLTWRRAGKADRA